MLRINPHRGARDVRHAIGSDFSEVRDWSRQRFPLDELDESPASRRDVKRYAALVEKRGTEFPPVVLIVHTSRVRPYVEIVDGAHRIAAARLLGRRDIDAYVGRQA